MYGFEPLWYLVDDSRVPSPCVIPGWKGPTWNDGEGASSLPPFPFTRAQIRRIGLRRERGIRKLAEAISEKEIKMAFIEAYGKYLPRPKP